MQMYTYNAIAWQTFRIRVGIYVYLCNSTSHFLLVVTRNKNANIDL